MEKASQDQARQYNLRRRQWTPAVGDVVWAKEHHLSKAAEGFAAKLAPRYNGPYQVVDRYATHIQRKNGPFTFASLSNNKTSRRQTHQVTNKRYKATGLRVRRKRGHPGATQESYTLGFHIDPDCEATRLCVRPKRESST